MRSDADGRGERSRDGDRPAATARRATSTEGRNRWSRTRYQIYAPFYDWLARPWEKARRRAIDRLDPPPGSRVLIPGCGTGSDLEHLPATTEVTAIDLAPAMVRRTAERGERLSLDVDPQVGDAQALPFADDVFDAVLLHLVLSVVPEPRAVVAEAARVLRPTGKISILDKFVPEGERPSLLRRAVNPLARLVFADLNRSLDPMLSGTGLRTEAREPYMAGLYTITVARFASGRRSAREHVRSRNRG